MQHSKRPLHHQCSNLRFAELVRFFRSELGGEDVQRHIFETLGDNVGTYSAVELGRRLQLTYERRKALGIRTIQCVDKTPTEIAELALEEKRHRERERRARKKTSTSVTRPIGDLFNDGDMPERTKAVFDAIHSRNWMTSAEIETKANTFQVFRSLTSWALHRAVHRALQDLQQRGLVKRRSGSARGFEYRTSRIATASLQVPASSERRMHSDHQGG